MLFSKPITVVVGGTITTTICQDVHGRFFVKVVIVDSINRTTRVVEYPISEYLVRTHARGALGVPISVAMYTISVNGDVVTVHVDQENLLSSVYGITEKNLTDAGHTYAESQGIPNPVVSVVVS